MLWVTDASGRESALTGDLETKVVWSLTALLVVVGVVAAIGRAVHVSDAGVRLEAQRRILMPSLPGVPDLAARAADAQAYDAPFAAHPMAARLHVIPGAVFLLLAPLQFSSRLRRRYLVLHRWTGRIVLAAAVATAVTGLFFGLLMPFAGPLEAMAIALFGGLLLVALTIGYVAIRHGEIDRHREWMIRTFAIGVAISTVRLFGAAMDLTLTPLGYGMRDLFLLSVWAGWAITVVAAEAWIRHTRPRMAPSALASRAV